MTNRQIAEMVAKFRTPPGISWEPLADDIETLLDSKDRTDDHYWDAKEESAEGPFVVWEYYGYEGWHPTSYSTLDQALSAPRDQSEFAITKVLNALDKSKKTYVR